MKKGKSKFVYVDIRLVIAVYFDGGITALYIKAREIIKYYISPQTRVDVKGGGVET